jgi:hydrogenase maturation protease
MLVAGVGNVFLGDDAFGVEVANQLQRTKSPDGVEVVDVGIRGVHLAYQLMDGYAELVLVDAVSRGDAPGTVTVMEPSIPEAADATPLDPHRLEPAPLLASLRALGALPDRVLLVGCETRDVDEGMGLTPEVEGAVGHAVAAVRRLIDEFVEKGRKADEEEAVPGRRAGADRLRPLPPTARHRALRQDPADVTLAPSEGRS